VNVRLHVRDGVRRQPVGQRQKPGSRRAERLHLLDALVARPGSRTHAATVFLCTSRPAHRSSSRSIAVPPLCGVPWSGAMESTGVYWKTVYAVLEERFRCVSVNATHVKHVPGRKTDVADCAWIAQLLEHGLVRGSSCRRRQSAICAT
jgi:hypothetical protein